MNKRNCLRCRFFVEFKDSPLGKLFGGESTMLCVKEKRASADGTPPKVIDALNDTCEYFSIRQHSEEYWDWDLKKASRTKRNIKYRFKKLLMPCPAIRLQYVGLWQIRKNGKNWTDSPLR